MTATLAWHFVGDTLRDGRPVPPDGEWLVHDGECRLRKSGLHASEQVLDALGYAPGPTVCRVAVRGIEDREDDKLVARERCILWRVKIADDLLRAFARKAALSVIHLWNAPDLVRRYLETGEEDIRAAARAAAQDASWDAAWDDAQNAAWDAAQNAARTTAPDAAWAAARDAVWAAAPDAARAAAWNAAWDEKWAEFNSLLESMIREAAGNPDDDALMHQLQLQL